MLAYFSNRKWKYCQSLKQWHRYCVPYLKFKELSQLEFVAKWCNIIHCAYQSKERKIATCLHGLQETDFQKGMSGLRQLLLWKCKYTLVNGISHDVHQICQYLLSLVNSVLCGIQYNIETKYTSQVAAYIYYGFLHKSTDAIIKMGRKSIFKNSSLIYTSIHLE